VERSERNPSQRPKGQAGDRLTVAIATFNGRHLLETALPPLRAQTFEDFRIVVVDDASDDDTITWLSQEWPEVEVVAHPRNMGVTRTLNSCLRAGESELVALLNNDVELDAACLAELARALDEHPEAAVAAAKLIDFHDREILDGTGDTFCWKGFAGRRGQGQRDTGQYEEEEAVFGACAGAAMYRRTALERVGPFDEDFYALQEDVDWSFRAQLHGYSCRYVPSAVAYHMGSATLEGGRSDFSLYHNWRNSIWIVLKNYPAAALVRHGHEVLSDQAHNLVWARQTGRLRVFLRAWRDALRGLPGVLRKRRAVQSARTVGLKELERVIGAER
jgi:GT2 family glycosyltransferase